MALMIQVGMEFIARDRSRAGMNSFQRNITTMTRSVLRLAGIGGGLYMLRGQLKSIWDATLKQESAERALEAAVGTSIESYKRYAAELQKVTKYGDEEILNQMAYARNLGVTADKLNEAATAAIGLAAKYRIDLSSAMMLVGRASMGQTQLLTRYGIVLDESLTAQEKFNELLRIGADAFHLAEKEAASHEGTLAQLKNTWGDLQETVGDQFVPAVVEGLQKINKILQDNDALIKRYIKDFREGMEFANKLQGMSRQMLKPWWLQIYEGYKFYRGKKVGKAKAAAAPDINVAEKMESFGGYQYLMPEMPAFDAEKLAQRHKEANKKILADTREYLASTRAMHDKTRMEKIRMLEDYREAHFGHTAEIEAGEKLLNDEILALLQSRQNAMEIYQAELRADMKETSLYVSERFAEASMSIEQSISGAFQSMIADRASWRDAMNRFFTDVGNAFAKMAADMVARALMQRLITPLMGGLSNWAGSLLKGFISLIMHEGGVVGKDGSLRVVSAMAFAGAPRLHNGLASDEFPAILQRGERVIPKGEGEAKVINNFYINAIDTKSFQEALASESDFIADLQISEKLNNHASRKF